MSRVDFGAKPWVFPMPVLIVGTYDEKVGKAFSDGLKLKA